MVVFDGELDEYGRAGVVLVFYLGLGESGLVGRAPVDGFFTLVNIALSVHLAKDLDFLGLERGVHREIRFVPVAENAEAYKLVSLAVDEILGESAAGAAKIGNAHLLAVYLVLFDDGALDGHAVVVPAGGVRRQVAAHGEAAVDEILEYLVHGGAHVNIAV
ncbi:hypothetical protein SDC9_187820 [bioreactor metagenome]|uniref:Uncharacterized protein n=1 Tax=bioreactor metagenome TaxID=1076179 RepID=A0A645HVT4_9ZZZZ